MTKKLCLGCDEIFDSDVCANCDSKVLCTADLGWALEPLETERGGRCYHCNKRKSVKEALRKRGLKKLPGPFKLGQYFNGQYDRTMYTYCNICKNLYFAKDEADALKIEAETKAKANLCFALDGYVAVSK